MKQIYIAMQQNPEYQISDLYSDEFDERNVYENMVITGNREYESYGQDLLYEINKFHNNYEELFDIINIDEEEMSNNEKIAELKLYFPHCTENISAWKEAINTENNEDFLEALTGKKYYSRELHGCSQSDWNTLYYPEGTDEKTIYDIETRYFNLGSEWYITTNDPDEEEYNIYTTSYNEEDIRKEIADYLDADPDQIVLRKYSGEDQNFTSNFEEFGIETEKKDLFVADLGHLFNKYGVSNIETLRYIRKNESEDEYVEVNSNNKTYKINITGDNNLAIAYDVIKAIFNR